MQYAECGHITEWMHVAEYFLELRELRHSQGNKCNKICKCLICESFLKQDSMATFTESNKDLRLCGHGSDFPAACETVLNWHSNCHGTDASNKPGSCKAFFKKAPIRTAELDGFLDCYFAKPPFLCRSDHQPKMPNNPYLAASSQD